MSAKGEVTAAPRRYRFEQLCHAPSSEHPHERSQRYAETHRQRDSGNPPQSATCHAVNANDAYSPTRLCAGNYLLSHAGHCHRLCHTAPSTSTNLPFPPTTTWRVPPGPSTDAAAKEHPVAAPWHRWRIRLLRDRHGIVRPLELSSGESRWDVTLAPGTLSRRMELSLRHAEGGVMRWTRRRDNCCGKATPARRASFLPPRR